MAGFLIASKILQTASSTRTHTKPFYSRIELFDSALCASSCWETLNLRNSKHKVFPYPLLKSFLELLIIIILPSPTKKFSVFFDKSPSLQNTAVTILIVQQPGTVTGGSTTYYTFNWSQNALHNGSLLPLCSSNKLSAPPVSGLSLPCQNIYYSYFHKISCDYEPTIS